MIDLVFKNYTSQKSPNENFFRKIFNTAMKELKVEDKKVEISLSLVGEAKIRGLNKKYRDKNEVTDVLSFPLLEWAPSPAKRGDKGTLLEEAGFKKYAILPLGDIFICLPFGVKESERQKISFKKEMAWLTIHGFLHLLGYDHEKSANDKKKMDRLESKILNKLNI